MTSAILTRRGFLRIMFLLGAIVSTRRLDLFVATDETRAVDLLAWKLAKFFHNRKSARVIGVEYLRSRPMEADARRVTKLICSRWQERYDEIAQADMENVREMMRRQQREDFENGRVVNVQGWILSETEARLCALTALV